MKNKYKKHPADGGDELVPGSADAVTEAQDKQEPAGNSEVPPPKDAPAAEKAEKPVEKPFDERYLRLLADFDNFRKRSVREKLEAHRTASEDFLREMLPVLDHMELTLEASIAAKADQKVIEGFRMVMEQLKVVVMKFGLKDIEAAAGKTFDPDKHDAVSQIPSEHSPENTVIAQTRRGYLLGDRVLRPAQVVVSSGPSDKPDEGEAPKVEETEAPGEEKP